MGGFVCGSGGIFLKREGVCTLVVAVDVVNFSFIVILDSVVHIK